jgi:hypothetical protein
MQYGNITVELNREPVEVSVLVEGQHQSGRFIANHDRRGITLADTQHQILLTTDEALTLLTWLQAQEPTLQAMVDEEAQALAAMEQREAGGSRSMVDDTLRANG